MFPSIAYLEWARRFHGTVRYDLATSGIPLIDLPTVDTSAKAGELVPAAAACELLRAAIASYNGVPLDEVIAALGTTHALWLAYCAITKPGDEILVEDPAYEPMVAIAEGMGVRARRFARLETARFSLDPERIARGMSEQTRAVVLTNLHNPSGTRATDDELRAVAGAVATHGAVLIVDEVYAPFDELVDERGVFGRSARRLAPNILAVGSLTKCYGLGAERVGWLLAPPEIVAHARAALIATAGALPVSQARQGLRAFGQITNLADRARAILAGKRTHVSRWVQERGWGWSTPSDGLFGFASITDRGDDLTPLIERAARSRGVLVTPGAFFGAPSGFRLAWSAPEEDLKAGLAELALALGE
jgi:aspartate/methionine/tyrosine aminotransferase